MRKPEPYRTTGGDPRWKVRYRSVGVETSQTFRRADHANTFAALLGSAPGQDGVAAALSWLAGLEKADTSDTFGQWFDTYLQQLTGITPRTRDDYAALHRRYLLELDPLPLPLITRAHVAGIVNRLEREGKSPKTIKNAIHMLSSCLALAVDEGHIPRNPVKRVRLPKQALHEDEERFLTHDEAAELVRATPAHYQPFILFLLGTGVRWSEATALRVGDIDLDNGTVRVRRAWKKVTGGWVIGPPKTPKANRTVNAAVPALAAVADIVRNGKATDYVFATPTGKVVRHSNFYNRIWQPACKTAGLGDHVLNDAGKETWEGPSPHDLRHTHASWLISDGIGLEAVQDQLGHESLETTRKVYAKLMPAVGVAAGRSASAAMQRVLEVADGTRPPGVLNTRRSTH